MASGSKTFLNYSSASPLSVDDVLLVVTDVASGSPLTHSATVQQILDNAADPFEIMAGSGIDVDTSGSTVTVSSTVSASSIAPSTANYIVSSVDSVLTNEKQLTAGSNIEIDTSGSQVFIHSTASGGEVSEWVVYSAITPTLSSADDPIFVMQFAGVDLTGDIAVGNRVSWVQNSITRYGIVHAISFSTNTLLTVMTRNDSTSTDYDVLDTGTYSISDFKYSKFRFPIGFPADNDYWSLIYSDTTRREQTSTVVNQWYNIGEVAGYPPKLDIPIGEWMGYYSIIAQIRTANAGSFSTTLSTANNTESNSLFTSAKNFAAGVQYESCPICVPINIKIASKTTYYLNGRYTATATIAFDNGAGTLVIKLTSKYL